MSLLRTDLICRVSIALPGVPERRGTGFLVAAGGLVLTARHVVWNEATQKPHRGALSLVFDTQGANPVTALADIVYVDPKLDFALLRAKPPASGDPLPAGSLPIGRGDRAISNPTYWVSFGYTESLKDVGGPYWGALFRTGLRFQLKKIEGPAAAASAEGLSGGPCIVHGEAVAVIVSELAGPASGARLEDLLYALPLEAIDEALQAAAKADPAKQTPQLPLGPKVEVPYQGAFRNELSKLDGAKLAEMGRALELNDLDGLEAPAQIDRIVRALFAQGVDGAISIVTNHHDVLHPQEKRWPDLAETFWVSPSAVSRICERASPLGGPIAFIAKRREIVRHHLCRALHQRFGQIVGTELNVVEVGPAGADVESAIREALRAHFKSDGAKLLKDVTRKKVVFVVVDGPVSNPGDLQKLKGEMPELCFVVVQAQPGAIDPQIELVSPAPALDAQDRLMTGLEDAREDLQRDLERLHESGG